MAKEKNSHSINVRYPQTIYDKIKEIAESKGIPISVFVRMATIEYLQNIEKE